MEIKKRANQLIQTAIAKLSSDLCIFPRQKKYYVYYYQGGRRKILQQCSQSEGEQLILYFKYIAGMNISEKRKSQAGACLWQNTVNLRLSTVATFDKKESLVVRLLLPINQGEDPNYRLFYKEQYSSILKELQKKEDCICSVDQLVQEKLQLCTN